MCVKYYVSMYLHTYYIHISNFISYRENTHSFFKSPVGHLQMDLSIKKILIPQSKQFVDHIL